MENSTWQTSFSSSVIPLWAMASCLAASLSCAALALFAARSASRSARRSSSRSLSFSSSASRRLEDHYSDDKIISSPTFNSLLKTVILRFIAVHKEIITIPKHKQQKLFLLDFFVHFFLLLLTLLLPLFLYLVDFLRHFKHGLLAIFLGCLWGTFSLLGVVFDQLLTWEKIIHLTLMPVKAVF